MLPSNEAPVNHPPSNQMAAVPPIAIIAREAVSISNATASNNAFEPTINATPSPAMTVFPNPTRSKTTLKVSGVVGSTNIYLTSANGKLLEHRKVELIGTNNQESFNLTPHAAGMYFITV